MQAVGAGAGVHREGHHGGAQPVPQGVVQKHTWHIENIVSMMARSGQWDLWDNLLGRHQEGQHDGPQQVPQF